MSRFRIRKKLKGLLGNSPQEIVRHEITYILPDDTQQTLMVEEHYSLLMAADANNITISTGRRAGGTCPDGLCGLCRVQVINETGLSTISQYEQQAMDDQVAGTPHEGREREPGLPVDPGTRLGCHTKILGSGAVVQIPVLFDPNSISGESAEA